MKTAKEKWMENKMKKIYAEGIRGKAPVKGQAYAVALSMYGKKKK